MGGRHLFLSKFEPHEYIIYSKKTNKELKGEWFERGENREREINSPMRSSWDSPKTDPLASYHTIRKKKKTTLVFASCDSKITSLLCDQLH